MILKENDLPDDVVKSLGEVSRVIKNYKRMALKALKQMFNLLETLSTWHQ